MEASHCMPFRSEPTYAGLPEMLLTLGWSAAVRSRDVPHRVSSRVTFVACRSQAGHGNLGL